jgi:maltooligosyltrehalose trehalohydrolase
MPSLTSPPFLEQLAGEVKRLQAHLGRSLVVIAESDLNDPRVVTRTEAGGYGIDAQWSDDLAAAILPKSRTFAQYGGFPQLSSASRNRPSGSLVPKSGPNASYSL